MVLIWARGHRIPRLVFFMLSCACGAEFRGVKDYLAFRRKASEAGWMVTPDGVEICPECRRKS